MTPTAKRFKIGWFLGVRKNVWVDATAAGMSKTAAFGSANSSGEDGFAACPTFPHYTKAFFS
jgi:hypothetical protein